MRIAGVIVARAGTIDTEAAPIALHGGRYGKAIYGIRDERVPGETLPSSSFLSETISNTRPLAMQLFDLSFGAFRPLAAEHDLHAVFRHFAVDGSSQC